MARTRAWIESRRRLCGYCSITSRLSVRRSLAARCCGGQHTHATRCPRTMLYKGIATHTDAMPAVLDGSFVAN